MIGGMEGKEFKVSAVVCDMLCRGAEVVFESLVRSGLLLL